MKLFALTLVAALTFVGAAVADDVTVNAEDAVVVENPDNAADADATPAENAKK